MHFFSRAVCLSHFLEALQTVIAIKRMVEDTLGHAFTDQTVVFYMETTCGRPDDQREFDRLYICIPAIMVSTDCVYLSAWSWK